MKRLLFSFIFFCVTISAMAQVGVYVRDADAHTNVRNAPRGKVVGHLQADDMITVDSCVDGWFHITENHYTGPDREGKISNTSGALWIHSSVIMADWIVDGNLDVTLYQEPSASSKSIWKGKGCDKEGRIAKILDLQGDWVKVRLDSGHIGWVPAHIICGNSLTICC